ncbi:MAG: mechanosensitive ion channel family protein [Nitrospirota bacterium]|nr:mechanosensitive ion channel family protein [Nitrospirota bacterium]MDH5586067.1 mechanosensitive ion channel family protein [Nitrospirota bacterium]MDH5774613.1 mechanosensitive ion channel family protein [Nitrospirota bacterium]
MMIEDFWEEFLAVWDLGILNTSLGDIFTAFGIFLTFLFARRIVFRLISRGLRKLAQRTQTDMDDRILEAMKQPLEFTFVIIGLYISGQVVNLSPALNVVFGQIIRSLIAFTLFWAIFRILDPLSILLDRTVTLFGSQSMHETIKGFFVKVAKFVVVCLGIAAVFQEWGFNVAAVLGSLGLVGMAVALGAQDFIKNMFAGMTIFLDKVFEQGNWIKTPDVEGTVEEIGFRATKVRQFDKALVTLPNSKLANEALINYSRMTNRRIHWMIGVEYRSTKEQILNIIQALSRYIHECGDFETDPEKTKTFIFLDSFGSSSIDIMLYCFTKTTVWGEWLEAKERLAYKIKEIVEGQNASFAFPSTSLYVETLPFGTPEPFAPPSSGSPPPSPSLQ